MHYARNPTTKDIALIAAITAAFFSFVFAGQTIGSTGQQMMAYFPWRGAGLHTGNVATGYPSTDFADSFFPHWRFLASELKAGRFPLWYPLDFSGTRAPETGLFGFYYPFRLLFLWLLEPLQAHTAMMVLHSFLSTLFSFCLLRWLQCSRPAAVLGAMVWCFNGHNTFYISLEFVLISAAWLPLALWAIGQAVQERSWRWSAVGGVATGFLLFNGYANYSYVFGIMLVAWWLILWFAFHRISGLRLRQFGPDLAVAAVFGICALTIGAAYWVPFIDVFRTAVRVPATLEAQISQAIPATALLKGMVYPDSLRGPVWGYDSPSMVFVGIIAAIAAPFALARRSWSTAFFAGWAALAAAFVTGFVPLYYVAHKIVPFFGAIHPSTIGSAVFALAVAVLAAFGLDQLAKIAERWHLRRSTIRILLWCFVLLNGASLMVLLWVSQPRESANDARAFPQTELTRALLAERRDGMDRIAPAQVLEGPWAAPTFFAGSHASVGIPSFFGYDSLVQPENYWLTQLVSHGGAISDLGDRPSRALLGNMPVSAIPLNLLRMLSVKFVVAVPGVDAKTQQKEDAVANGELIPVYRGPDGTVWRLARATGRAFLATSLTSVPWGAAALEAVAAESRAGSATRALLHPNGVQELAAVARVATGPQPVGHVSIVTDRPNHIRLSVISDREAVVVLSDTWAHGWVAISNGLKVPIMRANFGYRAVIVPAGATELIFSYRPWSLIAGLVITFAGILILVINALIRSTRRFVRSTAHKATVSIPRLARLTRILWPSWIAAVSGVLRPRP